MIEYVKGQIAELTPATAVVDCHGVGYGLNISLNTFSALQGTFTKPSAKTLTCFTVFPPARNVPSSYCSSAYRASGAIRHA